MSDKLIFNPFLQIHINDEETDFLLYAPKPFDSLKTLVMVSANKGLIQICTK